MCIPSRKKIFKASPKTSQICNFCLSGKAPNPGPWRCSPRTFGAGKKLEGQQQFPVLASILGARLNRETLLEPEIRQEKKVKRKFCCFFKKKTNKQTNRHCHYHKANIMKLS